MKVTMQCVGGLVVIYDNKNSRAKMQNSRVGHGYLINDNTSEGAALRAAWGDTWYM